jgi:hypothetical protein
MTGGAYLVREVPKRRVALAEVLERWPVLRQSDLSHFDDCELSSLFGMRYEHGLTTHPMARGTIEHRTFAECLREMQRCDEQKIPVASALAILEEKLRQKGIAPEDRVRVPLREIPIMQMAVAKWASDNTFSIRDLIDVERRLECIVPYRTHDGELIERRVSGQLDALIARPPDEAVVIDWKGTWALPPARDEDAKDPGVSYHGYFQQQFYGLLVMRSYPSVNAVVLREFYHRRSKARPARVVRSDLPKIEERMSVLVQAVDEALASGRPHRLQIEALERHGHWKPSPGRHCFNCTKARLCPLDDDYTDGGIRTMEDAERAAAVRQVASAVGKRMTDLCKTWVDLHGPIPVKRAKGRLVLGYRSTKAGPKFSEHVPESADRPSTEVAFDPNALKRAMRESTLEARREREAWTLR